MNPGPRDSISKQMIAVGVGNSSVQFGRFSNERSSSESRLEMPVPLSRDVFPSRGDDGRGIQNWDVLREIVSATSDYPEPSPLYFASVFSEAADAIADWMKKHHANVPMKFLSNRDFPIEIKTEKPAAVGTDRIAAATAVSHLKSPDHPAIFVDAGTALTVNAVSSAGAFLGGAILPGTTTSGTALNKSTAQLPRIVVTADKPAPAAIGLATNAAIASGIYWGAVGAVKELIARMTDELKTNGEAHDADVFVTGGFGPALAKQLGDTAKCVPHLVLSGIALAVRE